MLGYTNDEKKDTMSFTYSSGSRLERRNGDLWLLYLAGVHQVTIEHVQ